MITVEQAKKLTHGTIVYDTTARNADGSPRRWKVNGKPITWKRDESRVNVPIKHGLYAYSSITELCLNNFCLDEDEASRAFKQ